MINDWENSPSYYKKQRLAEQREARIMTVVLVLVGLLALACIAHYYFIGKYL